MKRFANYYTEKLYPLQDGVLKTIAAGESRFYLTGGTAISRGFFNHRYSDDLDFFLNADDSFARQCEIALYDLRNNKIHWDADSVLVSENY